MSNHSPAWGKRGLKLTMNQEKTTKRKKRNRVKTSKVLPLLAKPLKEMET